MKKVIKSFTIAVVILLSVCSCTKVDISEDNGDSVISVAVSAQMEKLEVDGDVKATIAPVIRLSWADGDKVFVYSGTNYLGTLEVTLKNSDSRYAYLGGNIKAPAAGTTVLTLVYAKGFSSPQHDIRAEGKIRFTMKEQTGADIPFVVTGTIPYSGQTTIADQLVNFTFATGVVYINCIDLADEAINKVWLKGVNTACALTLSPTAAPVVGGIELGNISTTGVTGGNSKLSYYVGIPVTERASGRKLLIEQQTKVMESSFTSSAFNKGAFSSVMYKVVDAGPVIVIDGLKWAKQNLAISASGNMKWKGGNDTAVKVPGTDEDVINGDYFQWATYAGYCGNVADADKGLLIYNSFTSTKCVNGGAADAFNFKLHETTGKPHSFNNYNNRDETGSVPYFGGFGTDFNQCKISKYTGPFEQGDGKSILEASDDVASIIMGGSWRMPTDEECRELINTTYWVWDATDMGYYVHKPNPASDAGKHNNGTGTYSKSDALLFFPAVGNGINGSLSGQGEDCNVASSNVWEGDYFPGITSTVCARYMQIYYRNRTTVAEDVKTSYTWRASGYTVRPVSD